MRKFLVIILFVCFLELFPAKLFAQEFTALFYNVENFFFPENDSLEGDDDFCPEGVRHWTWNRYHQKLNSIVKLIRASNGWETPDFVCLCEIECREVLENLVAHPLLRDQNYGIVHRESKDHRGMDVAILFRKDKVELLDTYFLESRRSDGGLFQTRDMTIGAFLLQADTVLLAMNHWVSKYGGAFESESKRMRQAELLGHYIDSVSGKHPDYLILAGGDFNDDEFSKSCLYFQELSGLKSIAAKGNSGSYKYQGKWSFIDQVFVGKKLDRKYGSLRVLNFEYLLEEDDKYTGLKPRRTYSGYQYHGGISDHLPLLFSYGEGTR